MKTCSKCGKKIAEFKHGKMCADCVNQWHREHRAKNIERYRIYTKKSEQKKRAKYRHEAFLAYGGYVCACCGESEPMFLTIDHINNDGAEHRKSIKNKGGSGFYLWLRDNNYPEGFQILCRNCNWGKHANHGVCPHISEGSTTIPKGSTSQAIGDGNAGRPERDGEIVSSVQ